MVDNFLFQHGFRWKQDYLIQGQHDSGNCFFKPVADIVKGDPKQWKEVREEIVGFIDRHPKLYAYVVPEEYIHVIKNQHPSLFSFPSHNYLEKAWKYYRMKLMENAWAEFALIPIVCIYYNISIHLYGIFDGSNCPKKIIYSPQAALDDLFKDEAKRITKREEVGILNLLWIPGHYIRLLK